MNVIFLDFDGVMTSMRETPGSYLLGEKTYGVSKSCVDNLKTLCIEANAKVVITSNWRKFEPDGVWHQTHGDFKNPLPVFIDNIRDLYAGSLSPDRHVSKLDALRRWFSENGTPSGYVIFDDDLREGFQDSEFAGNFVLTDYKVGLVQDDIEKAKELFAMQALDIN